MSIHVFGAVVTGYGTAANNRGLNEGNVTTLQKLVWQGQVHTTVSAEAIRFALRRLLAAHEPCNRNYDDASRANTWADAAFARWGAKSKEVPFIDDDLLGFMSAEGAKEEGGKGTAHVRRAVLEITRAVSLSPWAGDVTFNAASPGATPSAAKGKGTNPVPYGTEMHATRYQYAFALTPDSLRQKGRAAIALRSLCSLGEVAGNHGRFLYDFSPESIVFRLTQDPAPRILYGFNQADDTVVSIDTIVRRVAAADIKPSELVIGGAITDALRSRGLVKQEGDVLSGQGALAGATIRGGVLAACDEACQRLG